MTDKPADEKFTPPRTFPRRKAAGIGMSVLAGGFALAGGSALLGGAASAASPTPTLSPSVAAQVAQAAAAPAPTPQPVTATVPAPIASVPAPIASTPTTQSADDAAIDAFFAAGYSYDDAVTLAKAWGSADPFETKVVAGRKLEAGEKLPIAPGPVDPATAADAAQSAAVDTFFAAGYTYDDAVQLAKIWGSGDPYQAKVTGGQKLLDGQTLPVKP